MVVTGAGPGEFNFYTSRNQIRAGRKGIITGRRVGMRGFLLLGRTILQRRRTNALEGSSRISLPAPIGTDEFTASWGV